MLLQFVSLQCICCTAEAFTLRLQSVGRQAVSKWVSESNSDTECLNGDDRGDGRRPSTHLFDVIAQCTGLSALLMVHD